jgi:hypothetical protein
MWVWGVLKQLIERGPKVFSTNLFTGMIFFMKIPGSDDYTLPVPYTPAGQEGSSGVRMFHHILSPVTAVKEAHSLLSSAKPMVWISRS